MNTELIITLCIVFLAIAFAIYKSWKYLQKHKKKSKTPNECSDCSSNCNDCPFFHPH